MAKTFVFMEVLDGKAADIGYELLDLARRATPGGEVVAFVTAPEGTLSDLGAADEALFLKTDGYRPDALAEAFAAAVGSVGPDLVLVGSTAVGMDVGTYVAARSGYRSLAYVNTLAPASDGWDATALILGGKMVARLKVPPKTVLQVLSGVGDAGAGRLPGPSRAASSVETPPSRVVFSGFETPEAGDVDITKETVLVSVGRGIGDAQNLEVAEDLAQALGAVVSSSRPVVDAGWLPKTRQVGKSGTKVKPKVYLAFGISGAPEHLEGMRDAECIVAVNTDPAAPIFDVAHYGIVEDILDFMPALTEAVEARRG